jgi:D-alanyl-D-alanine carboxypeptidase
MIQVGALETQKDAAERISSARSKAAKILARAKSFTEKIIKNDMTLYRARFAVISREEAENACKTLKSAKIVCIALRN